MGISKYPIFVSPEKATYRYYFRRRCPALGSNMLVRSITLSFIGGFQNNLAEVFTIKRRRAERKTQVRRSKVKVTLRGQSSKMGHFFLVRSITLLPCVRFTSNLACMFIVMTRS